MEQKSIYHFECTSDKQSGLDKSAFDLRCIRRDNPFQSTEPGMNAPVFSEIGMNASSFNITDDKEFQSNDQYNDRRGIYASTHNVPGNMFASTLGDNIPNDEKFQSDDQIQSTKTRLTKSTILFSGDDDSKKESSYNPLNLHIPDSSGLGEDEASLKQSNYSKLKTSTLGAYTPPIRYIHFR